MLSLYDALFYSCTLSGLLSLSWRLYHFIYLYIISSFLTPINIKKHGEWAVITGSTDGLGLGYAKYFAKKGMKVALIARNPEKLNDVAQKIESQFHVETLQILADFTQGQSLMDHLSKSLSDLDIGVLVNNVGVSYPFFLPYHKLLELEQSLSQNMIVVNDISLLMMTNIVLPPMLSKKRGIIINLSSQAGKSPPTPFLALYSASKAFVSFFSQALSAEYSSSGVIIQNVCPSFVSTAMTRMKSSIFTPTVEIFVESQVRTLGLADNVEGYWAHALYALFVPDLVKYWVLMVTSKMMRKSVQRKIERRAAKESTAFSG